MTRLIAVSILPYHSRTEERQFGIGSRCIREQAVEFVSKALLSHKRLKSLYVVLYRPHIVPSVRLTDVRRIIIGRIIGLEVALGVTRLHERRTRTIYITIVLGTLCKRLVYVLLAQMLCKGSNTSVIVCILQSTRQRPVITQCRFLHIIWHIAKTFIQSYAAIIIKIGCLHTFSKGLTRIYSRNTLQYRFSNNRCGMITYHHIRFRCPHIPHGQPAILLTECDKRIYHIACTLGVDNGIQRMSGTIGIPQRTSLIIIPSACMVYLTVGSHIGSVYIIK